MKETLHTILVWYFQHPSGKTIPELIDHYWDIFNIEEEFNVDQLAELFLTAAEISVLDLAEGIFYIADFEEIFNRSDDTITRNDVINKINEIMKEKRDENVSK